jgi:D-glucosaminate-6-phosphate ammonia-lyase
VINARGCATLAGGTLMGPEVTAAMTEAARAFVRIGDLEEAASRVIAEATGAEAGYVTSGAAAAVTLGVAAILAGLDPDRMDRLPDTGDHPNEILIQRVHRNPYDHMVRAAGARLVEFGDDASSTSLQMSAAIGPLTAGAFYHAQLEGIGLPFAEFAATAHAHHLPVIVDASVCLPPRANLRRFTALGGDLVAFSGGKTIRGPQASGILAGRADLLLSVSLQHQDMDVRPSTWARRKLLESGLIARPPGHGIGRSMKAGKEEIAGLLVALEHYLARDEAAEGLRWRRAAESLAEGLSHVDGLATTVEAFQPDGRPVASTVVTVDPSRYGRSAVELVQALERLDPIVMLNDADADSGRLRLDPENLQGHEVELLLEAFRRCSKAAVPPTRTV